ncbi:hypothetical protein GJ744_007702 [Endocarpon pusillum]|uniref:Uncharacterized protein n=1 Tax=Endocarpon pusillum TaxID=364733 RepID=A0A8H7AVA0_9EURO|nr:hypothetical protein GJ744_007702 [Endocarpon pusillum]
MEWRKREGGGPSRTRASSTPPANALDVLHLRDASNGPDADDGEELEEMPLIEPEGPCSNYNREGESEGEEWIESNGDGWIRSVRSASSTSSATTVLRVDSPVSASSTFSDAGSTSASPSTTLSLGISQPSVEEHQEPDRSKWPQWLLEQSTSTTDTDLQHDGIAPAGLASSQTSTAPLTPAPARGRRAVPVPAPGPNVSTNHHNAPTTCISHTTTHLKKRNTDKSQGAPSRLPVPAAPAATLTKEKKKTRSFLPVPRAVSGVGKRGGL